MLRKIAASTAAYGGGAPQQERMFVVGSGPYQGRTAVLYLKTSNHLVMIWSDPPLSSWSSEITVASDIADYPASCHMDPSGNIYLVYTVQTSLDLAFRKLTFSNGSWEIGDPVIIYDSDANYFPSIFKDDWGQLWVSWTRESGGIRYIHSNRSTSDGDSWGGGSADPGQQLNTGSTYAFGRLSFMSPYMFCVYTNGDDGLFFRRRALDALLWNSEEGIYSGFGIVQTFDCRVSPDKKIGVAFVEGSDLRFKEFDGSSWSGAYFVDDSCDVGPRLLYSQSKPVIVYGRTSAAEETDLSIRFSTREHSRLRRLFLPISTLSSTCSATDHPLPSSTMTNRYKQPTTSPATSFTTIPALSCWITEMRSSSGRAENSTRFRSRSLSWEAAETSRGISGTDPTGKHSRQPPAHIDSIALRLPSSFGWTEHRHPAIGRHARSRVEMPSGSGRW